MTAGQQSRILCGPVPDCVPGLLRLASIASPADRLFGTVNDLARRHAQPCPTDFFRFFAVPPRPASSLRYWPSILHPPRRRRAQSTRRGGRTSRTSAEPRGTPPRHSMERIRPRPPVAVGRTLGIRLFFDAEYARRSGAYGKWRETRVQLDARGRSQRRVLAAVSDCTSMAAKIEPLAKT